MGVNFLSWILLHLLVILLCSRGDRERELETPLEDGYSISNNAIDHPNNLGEHTHAHFTTHMEMEHIMDPSLMVFFTLKDLKVGKRMPIYFPKRDPAASPRLWPREEADSLPFSSNQLPYLLKFFSFSPHSPQAIAMENTPRECESKPIKGEVEFCATSLESMLEFTQSILGLASDLQVYATLHQTKSSVTFQNYTMVEILMEIHAPKMVACHTMPYPYAVFYCHSQESENRVYRVSLGGENGDRWKLWLFVTWILPNGPVVMFHFKCLGLLQEALLCATSSQRIISSWSPNCNPTVLQVCDTWSTVYSVLAYVAQCC